MQEVEKAIWDMFLNKLVIGELDIRRAQLLHAEYNYRISFDVDEDFEVLKQATEKLASDVAELEQEASEIKQRLLELEGIEYTNKLAILKMTEEREIERERKARERREEIESASVF